MNRFDKIRVTRTRSSLFDLSHEIKCTANIGQLIPTYLEEIVPGDKFRMSNEAMLRIAPILAPLMHRFNVYFHYFFVPNRIIWNEWEDFITGGEDGLQMPNHPKILIQESNKQYFDVGSLADYFGIRTIGSAPTIPTGGEISVSALPFRAYQEIFNEWFRDQTLRQAIPIDKSSTNPDPTQVAEIANLRSRAYEKDYFTSALPWPQRGSEVVIPSDNTYSPQYLSESTLFDSNGPAGSGSLSSDANSKLRVGASSVLGRIQNLEENQNIETKITINDLRNASRLQEWLEKNARAGSRYIEQILSHFGVRSSDARLQRPEYLGGGRQPIVISEVLNTTGDKDGTTNQPVGQMSGHGISVGQPAGFKRRFEEHGWVMGIMSICPRTAYQNGIHRKFRKFDKFDYYWPEFAHLGEQEIKNYEIFHDYTENDPAVNGQTFGYQARYAEYKYHESQVAGDFRDKLKFWHYGRQFATRPSLNNTFVQVERDKRIFAVQDTKEPDFYVQIHNNVRAIRPMPKHSIPKL